MIQLVVIFFNILAPVFTLVLIGYLVGPRLGIEARSPAKISYYILVPAFIFNIFKDAQIQATLAIRMSLFILAVTIGVILISFLVARFVLRASPQLTAAFVLVAAFGNVGNFGLPIIQFKLGEEALLAASVYFLILSTFGFIVGVIAASWHKGGGRLAVLSAFTTPGVLAVLPAFVVNGFDLEVPLFVDRSVGLLAGAMIPLLLLTLGLQLAAMGRPRLTRDVAVASTLRLVIGPILAIALAGIWGVTGIARGAGILQASMPAAVFASLIAMEYDLLPDFVTTTVLFSTLASAFTLTVVLAII